MKKKNCLSSDNLKDVVSEANWDRKAFYDPNSKSQCGVNSKELNLKIKSCGSVSNTYSKPVIA